MAQTVLDDVQVASTLVQTYARSLFELAAEANRIDETGSQLAELAEFVSAQPDLQALFASRAIPPERRAGTLERLFAGQLDDLVYRFLHVLNDKGRLEHLGPIARAYTQHAKAARGAVDVEVHTAKPLDETELQQVTGDLGRALGREAVVHPLTDESLIGGLRIRVGDRVIDGSVAAQLRRMRRGLMERGREHARASLAKADG